MAKYWKNYAAIWSHWSQPNTTHSLHYTKSSLSLIHIIILSVHGKSNWELMHTQPKQKNFCFNGPSSLLRDPTLCSSPCTKALQDLSQSLFYSHTHPGPLTLKYSVTKISTATQSLTNFKHIILPTSNRLTFTHPQSFSHLSLPLFFTPSKASDTITCLLSLSLSKSISHQQCDQKIIAKCL